MGPPPSLGVALPYIFLWGGRGGGTIILITHSLIAPDSSHLMLPLAYAPLLPPPAWAQQPPSSSPWPPPAALTSYHAHSSHFSLLSCNPVVQHRYSLLSSSCTPVWGLIYSRSVHAFFCTVSSFASVYCCYLPLHVWQILHTKWILSRLLHKLNDYWWGEAQISMLKLIFNLWMLLHGKHQKRYVHIYAGNFLVTTLLPSLIASFK